MAYLTIRLLGCFQVALDGQVVTAFESDKVRALLAYLVVEADRPHRREKLAGLLWPDWPESSARINLSHALSSLRQSIGDKQASPTFLAITSQTIHFNRESDAWADVQVLSALLPGGQVRRQTVQQLEEAAGLLRGELLEGFSLPGNPEFEAWLLLQRQVMARLRLAVLHRLAACYQAQGQIEAALSCAWQQVQLEPYEEEAHQQLLHLLALSGQRMAALAHYESIARLFRDELGAELSEETQALYRRIQAGEIGPEEGRERMVRGYDLLEPIGEGSYGLVYRAYQPVLGREVAVKVINPQFANQPDFVRRFEVEAQLVARLEHLHIVPLYDYWRDPDGAYLVMRFFRAGSLKASLANITWSLEAVVRVVDQVASALDAAHSRGVIHQDVKPENILIDEAGNAYLSDFGIARDYTLQPSDRPADRMTGSPEYASPEQWQGGPLTPATDLYSLGMVIWELLTGQHPFHDTPPPELREKHLHAPLPPAAGFRPELPPPVDQVLQRATAKAPEERYPDALALARAFRQALGPSLAEAGLAAEADLHNPYKGLQPFQEADAPYFFGRGALVERLVGRLEEAGPFARFLAVVGPSGSGKSSLVQAGLIPALRGGALPGASRWFVAGMVPGEHPLDELEAALLRVAVRQPEGWTQALRADAQGLLRAAALMLPDEGELLLVVDQFEELFTRTAEPAEAEWAMAALYAAVAEPASRIRVVITLRADFYDRPLLHPQFCQLLQQRTEVVVPLSAEELAQAVRGPAGLVGAELEGGLAATIVADVIEQPGALPMFQYALTELFEQREGRRLTVAGYRTGGGVSGALARRAEEVYRGLDKAGQATAQHLLLHLAIPGEGAYDARRRVLRSDLMDLQIPKVADTRRALDQVLDAFSRWRLLLFDRDAATRAPTVEVAHEALLTAWGRLRGWLEESQADLRMERLLATAAGEWTAAGQEPGFLLQGARLSHFEGWAAGSRVALTGDERVFLAESVAARQAREAEEAARRRRELEAAQALAEEQRRRAEEQALGAQRLRRRALLLAGALLVAVILAAAAVFLGGQAQRNASLAATREAQALTSADLAATRRVEAETEAGLRATAEQEAVQDRQNAEEQARLAAARELAAAALNQLEVDPELAVLLALQAVDRAQTPETVNALHRTVPSLHLLHILSHPMAMVSGAAISPDGRYVATSSYDQTAKLWDLASGRELLSLPHGTNLCAIAYSPDGSRLATAGWDGVLRVWQLSPGETWSARQVLTIAAHNDMILDVAFSPDGSRLATGGLDATARIWDAATGRHLLTLTGHTAGNPVAIVGMYGVTDLDFSPDGARLATAGADGTGRVWDVATGQQLLLLAGHGGALFGVDFAPDGTRLATSSQDNTTRIWDVSPGASQGRLLTVIPQGYTVAFGPDGVQLAVFGSEGTARVWDAETGQELLALSGHTAGGFESAFTPDGTRLVTVSEDRTARVWDLSPDHEILTMVSPIGPPWFLGFSPDGRRLLAGGPAGQAVIWDSGSGQPLLTLASGSSWVSAVFSPDGARVLTSRDNAAQVWDAGTGQALLTLEGHTDYVMGVVFSPDGRRLATASQDGTARVWDAASGQELLSVTSVSHVRVTSVMWGVAISPDGKYLATAGGDRTVTIWDMTSGNAVHTLPMDNQVNFVRFSPDGNSLAAGDKEGVVKVWAITSPAPVALFTLRHIGGITGLVFSHDGERLASCSLDGTAKVWDTATGQELLTLAYQLYATGVAFSPDGTRLAVGNLDGMVRIYTLRLEELIAIAHSRMKRSLTDDECRRFLHVERCPPEP